MRFCLVTAPVTLALAAAAQPAVGGRGSLDGPWHGDGAFRKYGGHALHGHEAGPR